MANGEWKISASMMAMKSANPIQEFLSKIKQIQYKPLQQKSGISEIIDLSSGNLCSATEEISDCIIQSLNEGRYNGYAPSVGYEETRQAILSYLNLPNMNPKDVILSSGSTSCLDIAITALADRGQNILVPKACNPIYKLLAHGLGVETVEYCLTANWEVDFADLGQKINNKTAALLINNPHNPTGTIYDESHLRDILDLAHRHRLPVIVDEVYRDCTLPGSHFMSAIDVNDMMNAKVPMLICGGIGRSFMVPGWRVGWILIHDPINAFEDVRKAVVSLSQRIIGCNTFIQGAICNIVNGNMEFRMTYMQEVETNLNYLIDGITNKYGLSLKPGKSIYAFIKVNLNCYPGIGNTEELSLKLCEEEGIIILPGEVFGMEGYVRVALDAKKDIFEEGVKRILSFCHKYYVSL